MAIDVHHPDERSLRSLAAETEGPIPSLVVHVHGDARHCVASFSGALSKATRTTIYAIVDLIASEEAVILDFSRADVVDEDGADAVDVLIQEVRAGGTDLRIIDESVSLEPRRRFGP
jgi:hypothetical protein